jgi:hypothetical protein
MVKTKDNVLSEDHKRKEARPSRRSEISLEMVGARPELGKEGEVEGTSGTLPFHITYLCVVSMFASV